MSALAGGADNAYTPEVPFDLYSILEDVKRLVKQFSSGKKRGVILRNEKANLYFTTEILGKIYEGQSENNYLCRTNVLGIQNLYFIYIFLILYFLRQNSLQGYSEPIYQFVRFPITQFYRS